MQLELPSSQTAPNPRGHCPGIDLPDIAEQHRLHGESMTSKDVQSPIEVLQQRGLIR